MVLIDSGSSRNFISERFASHFPNWQPLQQPVNVKVADGGILMCTHEVDCLWLVPGEEFSTKFKILPLKCYDAIIGMDWLELYSPMEVQWAHKWISFWHQGRQIKL